MEIRRFGPGHRRQDGPPGTQGIAGQVIWTDERAHVSELAFSRQGIIASHSNPNTTLFIVVSGGGWVQVGEERVRVNHGEAVVWPAGVAHGAYTEGSEMRAILVELPDLPSTPLLEAVAAREDRASETGRPTPARGSLSERRPDPSDHDESQGEPW